ncbi:MAG: tetratricopeptide repeat protein, partial [Cyclobacteriaceae bacterium]|nr:tetratricopeptide repeat protein [Cyclobacteriaceae bacterium SS2]
MRPLIALVFLLFINTLLIAQDVIDIAMYNQQLSFIDKGWDLIHQKAYHEASQIFEQAIELNDGNADAFVGAATAYMHLEKYDLATQRVDVALGMTRNQSDIYFLAGNIAFNSGNHDKALVAYTVAINNYESSEVKIDLPKCYFNRGNSYL